MITVLAGLKNRKLKKIQKLLARNGIGFEEQVNIRDKGNQAFKSDLQ